MDYTKYLVTTPAPAMSDILVIAFGKVGKELREFPVDSFYEHFAANSDLAGDPDFNCFALLRPGMCSNDIEVTLRDHGFRTFLSAKEAGNAEAREAYQREVDAKFSEFKRDLCVELSITDLPTDFIDQVIDDACRRLQLKKDANNIVHLQAISRAVDKQLVICRSLIGELRSTYEDMSLSAEQN